MKIKSMLMGALAALALAGSAAAQTDPTRLALARQVMEAAGGTAAAKAQLEQVFGASFPIVATHSPQEQRIMQAMKQDMLDEIDEVLPQIMETTTAAYAESFTEQELRDYLAWLRSPSGRSIVSKLPAVQQAVLVRETPMIRAMMPKLGARIMGHVCEEMKCTPEQRQKMEDAMAKRLQGAS